MNIASSAADIGESQAAYVIAMSDGKARDLHMVDNSFAIARFKARAATEPVKNCGGCKFLEIINVPIGEAHHPRGAGGVRHSRPLRR